MHFRWTVTMLDKLADLQFVYEKLCANDRTNNCLQLLLKIW